MRSNNNQNRGKKRRNGGSEDTVKKLVMALAAVLAAVVIWAIYKMIKPDTPITNITGEVASVVDGNTIKLKSGLTVELLGVNKTGASKSFLESNVLGKTVTLTADSHETKTTYRDPMQETVRAYVRVSGDVPYTTLNRYILSKKLSTLNDSFCQDSLEIYRKLVIDSISPSSCKNCGTLLDDIQLGKKMTPATFAIKTDKSIGTGFFINENGLALTNYHVLADANELRIYLSDEEGNITPDRNRAFMRILDYNKKLDYAIFMVQLDNNEKVPYLCLAQKRPERGTDVGIVGNPKGQTATFSKGQISALRTDIGLIQTDASMTYGNSGGPICDHYAHVVGIADGIIPGEGNLNFGVDIIPVREALDKLKDVEYYGGKK